MSASPSSNRSDRHPSFCLIKPSSLGDIVHALPSLHLLRKARPDSRITWIANTEWLPLLNHVEGIDTLTGFPRRDLRGFRALSGFRRWAKESSSGAPESELVIDLQGLFRSAMIARTRSHRSGIVGAANAREFAPWFYSTKVDIPPQTHAVEHCLRITSAAAGLPFSTEDICFPFGEGDQPAIGLPRSFVLVHPYSRGRGKTLDAASIDTLIEALSPAPVVLVGSRPKEMPVATGPRLLDLCGRTSLGELLWLSRMAKGVISVDSGPMHIAAAVNPNVIGIHTWSDPRMVGPYGTKPVVWKAGRICHRAEISDDQAAIDSAPNSADLEAIAAQILEV